MKTQQLYLRGGYKKNPLIQTHLSYYSTCDVMVATVWLLKSDVYKSVATNQSDYKIFYS